jgi:hypothetical protein
LPVDDYQSLYMASVSTGHCTLPTNRCNVGKGIKPMRPIDSKRWLCMSGKLQPASSEAFVSIETRCAGVYESALSAFHPFPLTNIKRANDDGSTSTYPFQKTRRHIVLAENQT